MFRHRGKSRTLTHNLKLASLLSFVAGIVNVSGLFAIQRLTTNVTGHFAFFADEMVKKNLGQGLLYLLYIVAFLAGAFFSNLLVEIVSRRNERYMNTAPVVIEILILVSLALSSEHVIIQNVDIVACLLLFAMGLQNALVTSLSNAVVRTTHLTGLFTDLGIELSQLFFYIERDDRKKLISSIRLRLTIIFFFFTGGVTGGYGYLLVQNKILLLCVAVLAVALVYDSVKLRLVVLKRRYMKQQ
jgi:uncharacterized membrane protein YoaK (UPF0700 family)